jgi:hypothetical protein
VLYAVLKRLTLRKLATTILNLRSRCLLYLIIRGATVKARLVVNTVQLLVK